MYPDVEKNLNERKAILFLIDIIDAYNPALKQIRGAEIEQLVKTVNPEICSTEEKNYYQDSLCQFALWSIIRSKTTLYDLFIIKWTIC